MNYLAHLYLSGDDEDLIIGNMAGDFIRQSDLKRCSPEIQQGIILHRGIDTFTDSHPVFRKGLERLRANHGKYAAVVQDILYDYILASSWAKYNELSLEGFATKMYEIFSRRKQDLPGKLKSRIDGMMRHHFIESYVDGKKVQFIFEKMDERTKYPSKFYKALDDYYDTSNLFEDEFSSFFSDLCIYVRKNFNVQLPS